MFLPTKPSLVYCVRTGDTPMRYDARWQATCCLAARYQVVSRIAREWPVPLKFSLAVPNARARPSRR
jgi:hypothetical protein